MRKDINAENYVFTGFLYLPNQSHLELNGEFSVDWSSLEGKMKYHSESRNCIQGNLINAQRFNVQGSQDNPRNFLIFAHFSKEFPNHHYFLAKQGDEFEGKYLGRANLEDGKVKGVDTGLYPMNIRYADLRLQDKEAYKVEIELFKK